MNLDALFRDYEARLAAQVQANLELDAREQQKAEFAKIQMGDRLAAQQGERIAVYTDGDQKVEGELESLGLGWIQLKRQGDSVLIPQKSILWWEGGNLHSLVDAQSVSRKLSFAFALRSLVRYRLVVRLLLDGGQEIDGVIERVGADFLDIKVHPTEKSGARGGGSWRTVPISRIATCVVNY